MFSEFKTNKIFYINILILFLAVNWRKIKKKIKKSIFLRFKLNVILYLNIYVNFIVIETYSFILTTKTATTTIWDIMQ